MPNSCFPDVHETGPFLGHCPTLCWDGVSWVGGQPASWLSLWNILSPSLKCLWDGDLLFTKDALGEVYWGDC